MSDETADQKGSREEPDAEAWPQPKSLIKVFLYPGLIMIAVVLAALVITNGMKIFPFFYSKF